MPSEGLSGGDAIVPDVDGRTNRPSFPHLTLPLEDAGRLVGSARAVLAGGCPDGPGGVANRRLLGV